MTTITSRRAILAGASMIPALALPAAAALPKAMASEDDLDTSIAAYRKAEIALNDVLDEKSEYEKGVFSRGDRPDHRYDAAEDAAQNVALEAMWNVISIVPASACGLATLMRFVRENRQVQEHLEGDDRYLAMFHQSIEDFACELAGLPMPDTAAVLLDA